jgi:hypothetical protein
MQFKQKLILIGGIYVGLVSIAPALAQTPTQSAENKAQLAQMMQTIQEMQAKITAMQAALAKEKARNDANQAAQKPPIAPATTPDKPSAENPGLIEQVAAAVSLKNKPPIKIGGAVRFNYTLEQFNQNSRNTAGDLQFDTFRLNLDGEIDNVILSAEWRYYDYMQVIHHAWVGYKIQPNWMVRAGVVKVPFGNLPYNSNSYYFSSNFYAGLEDTYQLGLSTTYRINNWRFDAAFLKNAEPNGFGNDSYSENAVGFDDGNAANRINAKAINTAVGRAEYTWHATDTLTLKPGASLMRGSLYGDNQREGNYHAYAAHLVADWQRWNLKLQYTDFDYALNNLAAKRLVYGAYAYNSYGPLQGKSITAGAAYSLPLQWGPISNLTFYNDFSRIYDKNADIDPTWMNVTGFSMTAGPVFANFDFVQAKNQTFVGGNLAPANGSSAASTNRLFNINLGYYF